MTGAEPDRRRPDPAGPDPSARAAAGGAAGSAEATPLDGLTSLLLDAADTAATAWAGLPMRVRARTTPWDAARGRYEVLRIDLQGIALGALMADRIRIRGRDVVFRPGLTPTVEARRVEVRVTITQAEVDRWVERSRLPFRVRLGRDGITVSLRVAGRELNEVEVDLDTSDRFLVLQPRRASFLGLPAPALSLLRGYLPLPPLPYDLRVTGVRTRQGEADVDLLVENFAERLSPDLFLRLRREFRPSVLARRALR